MNPTGTFAIAVDHGRCCFVRIDLATGEKVDIRTEWPKTFQPKKRHSRNIFVAEKRLIYSLFVDDNANKIFIVVFSVSIDEVIRIVKEYNTEIGVVKNSIFDFQFDQQGLICVYSSNRIKLNRTVFQSAKFKMNDNGMLVDAAPKRQVTLKGNWHRAFLYKDCYYLTPVHGFTFMTQLCRVSCDGNIKSSDVVQIQNANEKTELREMNYCSPAEIIGSKVFFYACNKTEPSTLLIILDLNTMKIEVRKIEINNHLIANNARVRYSSNGVLYLHGYCLENCEDKAHVYDLHIS